MFVIFLLAVFVLFTFVGLITYLSLCIVRSSYDFCLYLLILSFSCKSSFKFN